RQENAAEAAQAAEDALLAELEEAAPDAALVSWRESDETLGLLKALFALVPEEVRTAHGLQKLQTAVEAMSKAPARGPLNKIAGRAREVAEAAEALRAAH
ncbi:unnamed protein product, partial [Effrenium voratum]